MICRRNDLLIEAKNGIVNDIEEIFLDVFSAVAFSAAAFIIFYFITIAI